MRALKGMSEQILKTTPLDLEQEHRFLNRLTKKIYGKAREDQLEGGVQSLDGFRLDLIKEIIEIEDRINQFLNDYASRPSISYSVKFLSPKLHLSELGRIQNDVERLSLNAVAHCFRAARSCSFERYKSFREKLSDICKDAEKQKETILKISEKLQQPAFLALREERQQTLSQFLKGKIRPLRFRAA